MLVFALERLTEVHQETLDANLALESSRSTLVACSISYGETESRLRRRCLCVGLLGGVERPS
jgi:hypothetical protein